MIGGKSCKTTQKRIKGAIAGVTGARQFFAWPLRVKSAPLSQRKRHPDGVEKAQVPVQLLDMGPYSKGLDGQTGIYGHSGVGHWTARALQWGIAGTVFGS